MNKTSISLLAFLLLFGLAARAQKPLPPDPAQMVQHRVNFLTQKLGLSTSQQQQATTIFTNAANSQRSLHDQMRTAHQALETAVSSNNAGGIEQAANNIGNLTAQSIVIHSKAEAAFLQTLNQQQQSTYSQIMQEHEHGFGRRGFGPAGPRPF